MFYFLCFFSFFSLHNLCATISLEIADHVFIKHSVPARGITCSNRERIDRFSSLLENRVTYTSSWGPKVVVGTYCGDPIFLALAPVGSGAGLVFTELYSAGAEWIIRYGSEDKADPIPSEYRLVKVVDEADNLYGFSLASGVPYSECGHSLFASPLLIQALEEEAKERKLHIVRCICHHLENYHTLRKPEKFGEKRQQLENRGKFESFDMETAVLFQVASDFKKHAATVLQTVVKSDPLQTAYRGSLGSMAKEIEQEIFAHYILSALIRLPE